MTMLNRLASFADATIRALGGDSGRYAVHLVNQQTGRLHCVGGMPLTIFTCDPAEVCDDLMRNRDPGQWDVLVEQRLPTEI